MQGFCYFNWFVATWNPWFIRGLRFPDGSSTGAFTFDITNGQANSGGSFRVVHKL